MQDFVHQQYHPCSSFAYVREATARLQLHRGRIQGLGFSGQGPGFKDLGFRV